MKALSLMLLSFLWISSAQAVVEATCLSEGCLVEGWSLKDRATGQRSVVHCTEDDCENFGWYEDINFGNRNHTECVGDGCFIDGWNLYNSYNGQLLQTTSCNKGEEAEADCFTWGWTIRGFNQLPIVIECTDNDCRNQGWEIKVPGRRVFTVQCKPGGCFQSGWIQYQ